MIDMAKLKIKVLDEEDNALRLHFIGTDRAFLNALRRTMISDVPKFAIDQMRIELGLFKDESTDELYESNAGIADEQVAHRFAMIPIPTFHDEFHFQNECPECSSLVEEQRGCPACQIIYTVSERGTPEGRVVTAANMNVIGDRKLDIPETFGNIPLTKLFEGQVLHAYFYAIMGRGRDHSKYSPVAGVTFRARQIGVMNVKTRSKLLFDLDLNITAKDFGKDGKLTDIDKVDLLRDDLQHAGDATELQSAFKDAITLEEVPGEYIMKFQTDGSMSARTCLERACGELAVRFSAISTDLEEAL